MATVSELKKHSCAILANWLYDGNEDSCRQKIEKITRVLYISRMRGYSTFVLALNCLIEITAAQCVLMMKETDPDIRLIIVLPYPEYENIHELPDIKRQIIKRADGVAYYMQKAPQFGEQLGDEYHSSTGDEWLQKQCADWILLPTIDELEPIYAEMYEYLKAHPDYAEQRQKAIREEQSRTAQEINSHLAEYLTSRNINIHRTFRCLNPLHQDRNPSMSYYEGNANRSPHVFCHGCRQTYDLIGLIGIENGLTDRKSAFVQACKMYGYTYGAQKERKESTQMVCQTENMPEVASEPSQPETDYMQFFMTANSHLCDTDYHRGISLETLNRFHVGYDAEWIHPGLKNKNYDFRSPRLIIPTSKYSYLARDTRVPLPEGAEQYQKQKVGKINIFNVDCLETAQTPIFIVEGEIDAMSVVDCGFDAIGIGGLAVPKLTAELTEHKPAQPMVIALDNENTGNVKLAVEQLDAALTELEIPHITANPYGACKDANELLNQSRAELQKNLLKIAVSLVPEFQLEHTEPHVSKVTDKDALRAHRCAIFGVENLPEDEEKRTKLEHQITEEIHRAIDDGYTTFVTSARKGTELTAANYVIALKQSDPTIHLAIVLPYRSYEKTGRSSDLQRQAIRNADAVRCAATTKETYDEQKRNQWIIDQCARAIVISQSGYLERLRSVQIDQVEIVNVPPRPVYTKKLETAKPEYPMNLLEAVFQKSPKKLKRLPENIDEAVELALGKLKEREALIICKRYQEKLTLQQVGDLLGVTRERIRQIQIKAFRKINRYLSKEVLLPAADLTDVGETVQAEPETVDQQKSEQKIDATKQNKTEYPCKSYSINNAGAAWTEAEDIQLDDEFSKELKISEMARIHGRTNGAIRARLKKHGLISE